MKISNNDCFLASNSHGLGDCSTRGWREARLIFPVAFSLLWISVKDQTAITTKIDFVMTLSDLFWWWRLGVIEKRLKGGGVIVLLMDGWVLLKMY